MKIIEVTHFSDFEKFDYLYKNKNVSNFEVFQSYDFIFYYMKFYKNKKFHVIIYKDSEKFLILPLYKFKYYMLDQIGFIGSPNLSEINDIVHNIENDSELFEIIKKIFDFLKQKKITKFYFNNIKDGVLFNYLKKNNFEILIKHKLNSHKNNENLYQNSLIEKKENNTINFKLRKFYRQISKNISFNNNLLLQKNYLINFIKKNKRINIFNKKKFFDDLNFIYYLKEKTNLVIIDSLMVEEDIGSLIIGFNFNKKLFYSIPIYNKNYKKYSLGNYHITNLKKENFSKVDYFIFGPGDEEYKKKFNLTDDEIYLFSNDLKIKLINKLKNVWNFKKIF